MESDVVTDLGLQDVDLDTLPLVMYGNFDIILDLFPAFHWPFTTMYAPCAVLY